MTLVEILVIAVYTGIVHFAIRPLWNRFAGRAPLAVSAPYWAAFIAALVICGFSLILQHDAVAQPGAADAFALFAIAVAADIYDQHLRAQHGAPHGDP